MLWPEIGSRNIIRKCFVMDMHSLNTYHVQRKLRGKKKQQIFLIELVRKLIEKYNNPHPTASIRKP
jgi:hypothetical protein